MRVARHRVPHTSGLERGHAHDELAALNLAGKDILVDHPVVRILETSELHLVFVPDDHDILRRLSLRPDQFRRICLVCRRAVQIKLCRIFRIGRGKGDLPRSHSDIHPFLMPYLVLPAIDRNGPCRSDIDDAKLPSLAEILCAELVPGSQCDRLYRYCRSSDDAVDMAVNELDLACPEQVVDQKLLAESLRGVAPDILW